ncbi:unnamed protein product [Ectocarpus sp. CCAP 1310/34]|nr:unnamed protein product [Ectocarpus sp. CCAP 1310/34]
METAPKTELLAKTVVCGGMHTAALTSEGVVYCWGRADSGQLGIGAAWVHETSSGVMGVEWPRRVRGLLEGRRTVRQRLDDVVVPRLEALVSDNVPSEESIACGGFHTAAVTTDGECYTWGKEDFGMLGCSNEALLKHVPWVEGNGSGSGRQKAKAVACGGWHTAVVGEKGGVWMCGRGEYGRLGLGDQKSQWHLTPVPLERSPIPAPVPPSPRSAASAGSASDRPGGAVHGFGGTVDSSAAVVPPSPPPVAKIGEGAAVRTTDPASMVALGGSHSLVMTSSGRVFGFGRQDDGRLGVEVNTEGVDSGSMLPLEISNLQLEGWRVQSISAGGVHSAAILARRPE